MTRDEASAIIRRSTVGQPERLIEEMPASHVPFPRPDQA